MSNRLSFRRYLREYISVPNFYFQPPENKKISYPCIIYKTSRAETEHAGNIPYRITPIYEVVLVDQNPDSIHFSELLQVPKSRLIRTYEVDNLNHWVFQIHYNGTFPDINF